MIPNKYLIAVAVAAGCCFSAAYAQQQQPQEYTIKLTAQDLDVIGAGLGEQPFNKAAPLINKLRQQVMEQQQSKPDDKRTLECDKTKDGSCGEKK